MKEMVEYALHYFNHYGFSIIPVGPDKKPLIKWQEYQKRKPTVEEINKWWNANPKANVGIVTGSISGILVVDVDGEDGEKAIESYIPDSLPIPSCNTPRGGKHFYFCYPGTPVSNSTGILSQVDVRAEGGFVVAPPSVNGTGKNYVWTVSPREAAFPEIPPPLLDLIVKGAEKFKPETKEKICFSMGLRDESLFHTANCLIKGGMSEENTNVVLSMLAPLCDPPYPPDEVPIKTKSAIQRASRRERNISDDFTYWLEAQHSQFKIADAIRDLDLKTRQEKMSLYQQVNRLCGKQIEKVGDVPGLYRKLVDNLKVMDFKNADRREFSVILPLDLGSRVVVRPKNIIVVAGEKSAGKTMFMLNVVKDNMHRYEIDYLNSEMGEEELGIRIDLFNKAHDMKMEDWKFRPISRKNNFHDVVTDDKKIWIIDYMQDLEKPWLVSKQIEQVHEKLKNGICLIALQKASHSDYARGGEYTTQISRLYLTLQRMGGKSYAKILDAKEFRSENPRGLMREYKIVSGAKYIPQTPWVDEEELAQSGEIDSVGTKRGGKSKWA